MGARQSSPKITRDQQALFEQICDDIASGNEGEMLDMQVKIANESSRHQQLFFHSHESTDLSADDNSNIHSPREDIAFS